MALASGFFQRWRGLRPVPPGCGVLLRTHSVHTFGMRVPLLAVVIDRETRVRSARLLPPGRILVSGSACAILELPVEVGSPPLGAVLTWRGAGTPGPLRHSDRESG